MTDFRNKKTTAICEECGKKFEKKCPTQIYCSKECAVKVGKRQIRIYKGLKGEPQKRKKYNTGPKKKKHNKGMWAIWE